MTIIKVQDVVPNNNYESRFGVRHLIVLMLFLSTMVAYATRVSMSVAIVAMTDEENANGFQVFDWDRAIQDTILSSFFWGYVWLQIPAGMLAGRYGGKYFAFIAVFTNGIVNMFVPLAAHKGGWTAVCVCRIMMGLTQGLLFPSIHGLLGQWTPISERNRMGTISYAGAQLGTIIEMIVAGLLSSSRWGWPSVYYVAGATCLVWSALWLLIGASSPSQSRWISSEERKYIETHAGAHDIGTQQQKLPTPWKKIMTSLPFLSILLAHCGQSLGYWTLLTEMPSYMKQVLHVDTKANGFLSALPYTACFILSFVFSWIADYLRNNDIIKISTSRKIFNTIAFWGPAIALLGLCYLPAGHLNLAVAILTLTVGLNGAHYVGFLISHIDLSPNYASTLMGVTNGLGNVFSIMAPLSVSLVVSDQESASEWRNVFFISVAFYFLSNLFYLLFSSGEIQEWNEPKSNTDKTSDSTKPSATSNSVKSTDIELAI